MEIRSLLKHYQDRVEQHLQQSISKDSLDPALQEAMIYSLLNGGKRVRPALIYLVNNMLGGTDAQADSAAAAIECMHSYSLIHDDLPAMDNDDLRRGKPTCHIAFDEATAILAGDALQCLAFEIIADDGSLPAELRLNLIQQLGKASGNRGMVVGQSFDLRHEGQPLTLPQLEAMHQHKTGALLSCAVQMGAICSGNQTPEIIQRLASYSQAIGLAFQVQDDILDIEGDSNTLGKPQGSDLERNKPTYPALLSLEGAKLKLAQLHSEATEALVPFGEKANALVALADFIVQRDH